MPACSRVTLRPPPIALLRPDALVTHLTCVFRVRGAGTAAINMCLVASGCAEAYYEIGIHVWDVAAGSLIVSEAGGVLLDVDGKRIRGCEADKSVSE